MCGGRGGGAKVGCEFGSGQGGRGVCTRSPYSLNGGGWGGG